MASSLAIANSEHVSYLIKNILGCGRCAVHKIGATRGMD